MSGMYVTLNDYSEVLDVSYSMYYCIPTFLRKQECFYAFHSLMVFVYYKLFMNARLFLDTVYTFFK